MVIDDNGDDRVRLDIVLQRRIAAVNLMASSFKVRDRNWETMFHIFTHASQDAMTNLLRDAGVYQSRLKIAYCQWYDICDICASTGRSRDTKKVYITLVDGVFNE